MCRWPKVKNIVGPSKGTIMELKEARPRFSEKFITIYNSLDFEKVENLANEDIQESYLIQKPYLSAMGRLSDQKKLYYANLKLC